MSRSLPDGDGDGVDWMWAGAVAVVASVLGDFAGYGIGRILSQRFLEDRGQWIGYTPDRAPVSMRYSTSGAYSPCSLPGLLSLISVRSRISFAGVSHFRVSKFLAIATFDRVLWTGGYLRLGYAVRADLEAAAGFFTNLSLLIVSLVVLTGLAWVGFSRSHTFV